MNMEDQNNEIEIRSDELQEIIGRIPSSIEKYGLIVMSCIIIVLIIGCFFFYYPNTIEAPIIITNSTPPVNIVSKINGKIILICKANEDTVQNKDILGVLESDAAYQDVFELNNKIDNLLSGKITDEDMIAWMSSKELMLGSIQDAYLTFKNSLTEKRRFEKVQYLPQKIKVTQERISTRDNLEQREKDLHEIIMEQENIAHDIYIRDSLLHVNTMISDEDYERSLLAYSQSKQGPINRKVEEEQFKLHRINEKEELLDLLHQNEETTNTHILNCNITIRQLKTAIVQWDRTYVLRSPIDGVLNYTSIWNKNQTVSAGEILFIIVPTDMKDPIGKAYVPVSGMGLIKVGQTVIVKVNNFPDEDYGNLVGSVSFISNVPTAEGVYLVDVVFPHGLITSFHKKLPLTLQLIGTSQIVAENRRLSDLFIQPARRLIKKQETLNAIE